MPIGTAFHERTFQLCESLSYREWSGYYAVSSYEPHHEHEYNAIRNASALIDISPLYKYRLTGRDATRLVDRVITRDMRKVTVGQVVYTPWCDEHGKVIDDGTVSRLEENTYRWTAADPSLRWFTQNAAGMDVQIEDISESVSALALQGPTSGRLLLSLVKDADIVFSCDEGFDCRRAGGDFAHGIHGRSRLRDLDRVRSGAEGLGRAHGPRQGVRHSRRGNARA
jgi:aminomethyltransferase